MTLKSLKASLSRHLMHMTAAEQKKVLRHFMDQTRWLPPDRRIQLAQEIKNEREHGGPYLAQRMMEIMTDTNGDFPPLTAYDFTHGTYTFHYDPTVPFAGRVIDTEERAAFFHELVKVGSILATTDEQRIDQITNHITRPDSLFEKSKKDFYQMGATLKQKAVKTALYITGQRRLPPAKVYKESKDKGTRNP